MRNDIAWNLIERDFTNGISVSELTRKYNLSYGIINNYLIKNNIKTPTHLKISEEKYNKIKQLILNKNTLSEIKRECNVSANTVKYIASENNLSISKYKKERDIININFKDNYFSIIDTEEKAYFIGLLYTDGCVRKHNGGFFVNLSLQYGDKDIVQKFANELCCGNSVRKRCRTTNYGYGEFAEFETCNSKQLFDDLNRFDIIPDKTHKSICFKNIEELIPPNLIKHFLRGLIDGDGCISNRLKCGTENCIYFVHKTKECCELFDYLLKKYSGLNSLFKSIGFKEKSNLYCIRYRRIQDVKDICNFLYNDSTIYLIRKQHLAKLYYNQNYFESQTNDSFLFCVNE